MNKKIRTVRNTRRKYGGNYVSDETNPSIKDQWIKQQVYETCFKKNSKRSVLMDKRSIIFEVIAIILSSILCIYIIANFINVAFTNINNFTYNGPTFIVLLIVSLFCYFEAILSSNNYVKKKFKDRSFIAERFKIKFNTDILFSVRCDAIHHLLEKEKLEHNQIDYLIEYYTDESTNVQQKRWLPFAILSAFLFPFWNETVSNSFDLFEGGNVILLLFLAITLSLLIWMFKRNIESILFSKSNNYLYISNILRTIRSYSNNFKEEKSNC